MPLNAFEKALLQEYCNGRLRFPESGFDDRSLVHLGAWLLMEIGKIIRSSRMRVAHAGARLKDGRSPVTAVEYLIEDFIRESLNRCAPGFAFIGEETGGEIPARGLAVGVDPIDGTWSFLTHSESTATSLIFLVDAVPRVGMVLNAATAELGYILPGSVTRLMQFSSFGEEEDALDLPSRPITDSTKILINIHPSRSARAVLNRLYDHWDDERVRMVKSVGGSPSWALLEAAKGHFTYINLWSGRRAHVYDLAAGTLLVRGAGGEVTDFEGNEIPLIGNDRSFVAGVRKNEIEELRGILGEG